MGRDLAEIAAACEGCQVCGLFETRTKLVFGAGSPQARIVFIGEAPGKNEDLHGVPFVGAAGKLLDKMLASIDLARDDIYIANILKCRPPKNRDPKPAEIEACTPWLREQLESIQPEVLVTLGNFATRFILETQESITALHGQVISKGDARVLPVFHPAAAIYDRKKIAALEEDFRTLKALLEEGEG